MENLLNPDFGLVFFSIVVFLGLVLILGKFAWGPLLQVLNDREAGIRRAISDAENARQSADQMKIQLEKDRGEAQTKVQAMLAEAQKDAQQLRERLTREAQAEAQRLAEQSKRQLEEERAKLVRELRQEVADLSVRAAEKILRHALNPQSQKELLDNFFQDLDKVAQEKKN